VKTISLKKVSAVAVASLGFGLLSVVPANAGATTATSVSVSPIRASFQGTTADTVPVGTLKFTTVGALLTASTTGVITLSTAPTSTAEVTIDNCGGASGTVFKDTVGGSPTNGATALHADVAAATAVSCDIFLSTAPASGTYAGKFVLTDAAGSLDALTVSFSFVTAGAPKSIKLSKTTAGFPAVALSGGAFVGYETVGISLLDTAGVATQPSVGDSIVVSATDYTYIGLAASTTAASANITVSSSDLADGSHTLYIGAQGTTADTEVFTFTPAGVLPGNGVVAATLTATAAAIGTSTAVVTAVTAPTSASVIKAGSTATAKTADTSVSKVELSVTGWPSGSAYKILVAATDSSGAGLSATINDVAGLTSTLYGISTGAAIPVVVSLSGQAGSDTVTIDGNGDGDTTDTSDMVVTLTAATYAVTLTSPVVTPSISKTASALVVAGKVADSYSTAVGGATVSVSGAQTLSTGTASALTGTATSAADGTWTVTLAAANALTTSVALTVSAVKTGISSISNATATVNLNAAGGAASLTNALLGDEDSAATKTAATQLPAILVPYTGRATGISDELYVVSTGAFVNADFDANTETCFAVNTDSTPRGQIVATGTAGVLFYTTACTNASTHDVSKGVATLTVAATGSDNIWVTSTKTGLNTFTLTSGTATDTYRFYAYNQIAAGDGHAMRNVGAPATAKAAVGGISYVTLTPTDAFGNVVKSVAQNGGTITAKAAGGVLLDGPALSRTYNTTDSDGNILVGIIAGTVEGAATITITSTGAQFGAAAGAATGTTAGTNGLTASVSTVAIATTVGGASNPNSIASIAALIDALNAKIVALNALIAKIMRKLGVK